MLRRNCVRLPAVGPTIVVPGITASALRVRTPDGFGEFVWEIPPLPQHAQHCLSVPQAILDFDPEHPQRLPDAQSILPGQSDFRIEASSVFGPIYSELTERLGRAYGVPEGSYRHVRTFPYDWRQPLQVSEQQLAACVTAAVSEARQTGAYGGNYNGEYNLVAHSMGGLLCWGLLARNDALSARLRRLVTIATPMLGAPAALEALVLDSPRNHYGIEESTCAAVKLMPTTFNLAPMYAGGVQGVPPSPDGNRAAPYDFAVLNPAAYTPFAARWLNATMPPRSEQQLLNASYFHSTVNTMQEYERPDQTPLENEYYRDRALAVNGALLRAAGAYWKRLARVALTGEQRRNWRAIVGTGEPTRQCVSWDGDASALHPFLVDDAQIAPEGDGTVPLRSALGPYFDVNDVTVVRHTDINVLREPVTGIIAHFGGLHATLPRMDVVHDDATTFLM